MIDLPRQSIVRRGQERLQGSPYQAVRDTWCEFNAGVLTLRGCVQSFFHKQLAQQSVAGIEGVDRIDNQIEVVGKIEVVGPSAAAGGRKLRARPGRVGPRPQM